MDLGFDVVSLPDTDHLEPGETAPEFTRPLVSPEYWEDTSLSTLVADGPVLLVCHPMAGAFPTTYVWQEITDRGWPDRIPVVGLSISDPYALSRLLRNEDLREHDVRLYSDPANGVAERYGIVNDLDGMAGVAEPRPAVFLLDPDRTVAYAWVATEWPAFPPYDAIEAAIDDRG